MLRANNGQSCTFGFLFHCSVSVGRVLLNKVICAFTRERSGITTCGMSLTRMRSCITACNVGRVIPYKSLIHAHTVGVFFTEKGTSTAHQGITAVACSAERVLPMEAVSKRTFTRETSRITAQHVDRDLLTVTLKTHRCSKAKPL